jgi:dTDP-glucose pyrophosphorylase
MSGIDTTALSLVVLAAGGGERYGGLKQLAPVGPHGEAILEYSIHDALGAGFRKIVLVVRKENEQAFRDTFVDRLAEHENVEFAYQELQVVPLLHGASIIRKKPWGTAHAVIAAQPLLAGPFAVINGDDFYGRSAINAMGEFLRETIDSQPGCGALVGYPLRNTLSDHGPVSRGICQVDDHLRLSQVVEWRSIRRAGEVGASVNSHGTQHTFRGDELVSMNLWGFRPEVIVRWNQFFLEFVERKREMPDEGEFEIPTNVQRMIDIDELQIQVIDTDERWCGLTYREDLVDVQSWIANRIRQGVYPEHLWEC